MVRSLSALLLLLVSRPAIAAEVVEFRHDLALGPWVKPDRTREEGRFGDARLVEGEASRLAA